MSIAEPTYQAILDNFAEHLREARTAREIAARAECSKPTVYARIEALVARGVPIIRREVRAGATGPLAIAYFIAPKWYRTRCMREPVEQASP